MLILKTIGVLGAVVVACSIDSIVDLVFRFVGM
jgi:hypothetical protein